jgi:NTP pyrophosphatase (non-canonical NTP hydrolase)
MSNLYEDAINKWGVLGQIGQAMEECGELIAAINKYFIRDCISAEDLASEIADVEIMCKQLRYIIGNEIVDKATEEKIGRLKSRVYGN